MADAGITSLLRNRRYAMYLLSRLSLIVGTQMLSVAVGWQVYELTGDALALGYSGLALFLPAFFFALPGGHIADRHDRRGILVLCHLGVALSAAALAVMAHPTLGPRLLAHGTGIRGLAPIYAVLCLLGTIRAFSGPAGGALMPSLVPREELERAVAFGSSCWQLAMILGPSLGGVLYALTGRATFVFQACSLMALVAMAAVVAIGKPLEAGAPRKEPPSWSTVLAGLGYVWRTKVILGAISLDLFAVLLGGAVALLPIFARDLLQIGPWGLGVLRSAPGVGAALVALLLARFPLRRKAGVIMFVSVFVFGLATMAFGLSRSFALSLVALFVLGASDMISVVVRSTLVQVRTPDEMRGRVSAVNMLFIGASNELGEFESGATASLLGPRLAVLVGGVGTCLVVLAWSALFPSLRDVDRLDR